MVADGGRVDDDDAVSGLGDELSDLEGQGPAGTRGQRRDAPPLTARGAREDGGRSSRLTASCWREVGAADRGEDPGGLFHRGSEPPIRPSCSPRIRLSARCRSRAKSSPGRGQPAPSGRDEPRVETGGRGRQGRSRHDCSRDRPGRLKVADAGLGVASWFAKSWTCCTATGDGLPPAAAEALVSAACTVAACLVRISSRVFWVAAVCLAVLQEGIGDDLRALA